MTEKKMLTVSGGDDPQADRVQIDIPRRDLGDFLTSLLGQPRRIEKITHRAFSIDHAFLCHLDEILNQRIMSQQHSQLVAMSARIRFSDSRTRTETSQEAFKSFSDLSKEPSVGIDLIWTYLVQFPNRPFPEKQEISLSISTIPATQSQTGKKRDGIKWVRDQLLADNEDDHEIRIRISFTELTWGIDILNYIEGEIRKSFEEKPIAENFRFLVQALSFFFFPIIIAVTICLIPICYNVVRNDAIDAVRRQIKNTIDKTVDLQQSINLKLDYIMAQFLPVEVSSLRVFLLCAAIYLILGSIVLLAHLRGKSFLLLNQAAVKARDKFKKRNSLILQSGIVSFIVGAVAGVAGNGITILAQHLF